MHRDSVRRIKGRGTELVTPNSGASRVVLDQESIILSQIAPEKISGSGSSDIDGVLGIQRDIAHPRCAGVLQVSEP